MRRAWFDVNGCGSALMGRRLGSDPELRRDRSDGAHGVRLQARERKEATAKSNSNKQQQQQQAKAKAKALSRS